MKLALAAAALLFVPLVAILIIGAYLPREHVATRSATFPDLQAEVWKVMSGPPDWRPEVTRFEKLPDLDGHPMWREFGSHGRSIAYELMAVDAPRRMVTRIAEKNLPYSGTWTYELVSKDAGCELTITEAGAVSNPIFRFVSRYVMGETATMDAYLAALSRKLGQR